MTRYRVVDVDCQCGQHLFEYAKGGRGRLIKCFLDQICRDELGVVNAPVGARPVCPSCGSEVGHVRIIRGRPALKLNQGTVQKVTT
ncbi:MAG: hypothetical protein U9R72_10510 [Chloroflexota bacterium]|nr:hypothetical protein [Chloroflexota bacterium]